MFTTGASCEFWSLNIDILQHSLVNGFLIPILLCHSSLPSGDRSNITPLPLPTHPHTGTITTPLILTTALGNQHISDLTNPENYESANPTRVYYTGNPTHPTDPPGPHTSQPHDAHFFGTPVLPPAALITTTCQQFHAILKAKSYPHEATIPQLQSLFHEDLFHSSFRECNNGIHTPQESLIWSSIASTYVINILRSHLGGFPLPPMPNHAFAPDCSPQICTILQCVSDSSVTATVLPPLPLACESNTTVGYLHQFCRPRGPFPNKPSLPQLCLIDKSIAMNDAAQRVANTHSHNGLHSKISLSNITTHPWMKDSHNPPCQALWQALGYNAINTLKTLYPTFFSQPQLIVQQLLLALLSRNYNPFFLSISVSWFRLTPNENLGISPINIYQYISP